MAKKKTAKPKDLKILQRTHGAGHLQQASGIRSSNLDRAVGTTAAGIVKKGRHSIGKALGQHGKMVVNRAKKARSKKK